MKRALLIHEQEILLFRQENSTIRCETRFMVGDEAGLEAFLRQDDAAYLVLVWPGEALHLDLPPGLRRSDRNMLLRHRLRDQNCESAFLLRTPLPRNEGTQYQVLIESGTLIACLEQLRTSGRRIIGLYSPDLLSAEVAKTYAQIPQECMISWQIGASLLQIYLRDHIPRLSRRIPRHDPDNTLLAMRQFRSHLIRQQHCASDHPLTCLSLGTSNSMNPAAQSREGEFACIAPAAAASEEALRDQCLQLLFTSKLKSYSLGKYARENQVYYLALGLRISAGLLACAAVAQSLETGQEYYRLTQQTAAEDQRMTQSARSLRLLQEKMPTEPPRAIEEAEDWQKRPPPIKPILEKIAQELSPLDAVDLVGLQWSWTPPRHLDIHLHLKTENQQQAAQLERQFKEEVQEKFDDLSLTFDIPTQP